MKKLKYLDTFAMCKSVLLVYGLIPFCLLQLAVCTTFNTVRLEKTMLDDSCLTSLQIISTPVITHCISKCTLPCIAVDYDDDFGTCELFSGDCGVSNLGEREVTRHYI